MYYSINIKKRGGGGKTEAREFYKTKMYFYRRNHSICSKIVKTDNVRIFKKY